MNIKKLTLMAAGLLLVGNMEMSAQGLDRQATDVINEMAPAGTSATRSRLWQHGKVQTS